VATHSFSNLMRRLSSAGFKRDVVGPALLPDWWDDSLSSDESILPEIEIRVARFLNRLVSDVRDPAVSLVVPVRAGAVLRRVRPTEVDRLGPAIHTALAVAGAVARSLRNLSIDVCPPPLDPFMWRSSIERPKPAISLDVLLRDLWARGVPVVPVDILPTPKFQGLACIIDGRPIIVVGHQHDAPGRLAFVVGHEAGHIAAGDCALGHLIVDQDDEVDDQSEIERRADLYATRLLVGYDRVPTITATDFRELAKQAIGLERTEGVDATTAIFAWARVTRDYTAASMAVQALYRHTGGRALLRNHVLANVDFDSASESDRSLLRLVVDDRELAAAAD
jgi:hypothetical protein